MTIDGVHTGDLEEFKYGIVGQSTVVIDQISSSVRVTWKVWIMGTRITRGVCYKGV